MMKRVRPFSILIALHAAVLAVALGLLVKQKGQIAADKERIVVIPIDGVISLDKGSLGRGMSVESIVQTLHDIESKDDVKAVVLRINSPGGSVGAVQEIYRAVKKVRAKGKFVVTSFGDVGASGGYYVACAGDRIIANPGTLTGSIGVIMEMPNVEGLLQKIGVSMQSIKSGAMKDAGSPFRRLTDSERDYFQSLISDAYGQFFQAVKDGRKIDDATLKKLADGRVFSGHIALDDKLVDELGGIQEAIEAAKKLSGLSGKNPAIVYQKEKQPLAKFLDLLGKSPLEPLSSYGRGEMRLLYMMQ